MQKVWFVLLLILVPALAACGGKEEKTSATETPTLTPVTPTVLPPTWTPTPEGFVPSKTPTPAEEELGGASTGDESSGQIGGGQEFPPTWTPGKPPSSTPRPTQTRSTTSNPSQADTNLATKPAAPTWTPQPEECYNLRPLVEDQAVFVGMSATISWAPVTGYDNYLIEVRHPGGGISHSSFVKGTSYEIPSDVFSVAGAFGWEVWAVRESGERVCFPSSGEIVVSFEK